MAFSKLHRQSATTVKSELLAAQARIGELSRELSEASCAGHASSSSPSRGDVLFAASSDHSEHFACADVACDGHLCEGDSVEMLRREVVEVRLEVSEVRQARDVEGAEHKTELRRLRDELVEVGLRQEVWAQSEAKRPEAEASCQLRLRAEMEE
ncbi:unnamed protein product, partial [Polarella glacialis]